jgi:hypothetical protein
LRVLLRNPRKSLPDPEQAWKTFQEKLFMSAESKFFKNPE